MTVDLLVVHPGAQHGIYGELGDQLTALEPPTWARILAGYVRRHGYRVAVCDAEALQLSPKQVATLVADQAPRVAAIVVSGHQPSASTQQMVGASAIAREIFSSTGLGTEIVMLGNHPSALPERTLREEAVDYVVDGEGPETVLGLLEERPLGDVPGLVWYDKTGQLTRNPSAALLDPDELHGDAWDLLPMERYRSHNWHAFTGPRQPYASIYTTLGCPYKCSFCMINSFQHTNRYRRMDPYHVVDRIEHLYRHYVVRSLKIADEMFVLNEDHYLTIAQELIRRGLGRHLNLWAYARVDTVKPNTLSTLRSAGFRWLALGIESASAHVRDGANKRLRTDDIVDTVRTVQRAGIAVVGNFMFGLRDDTADTMQQTLDLALACLPEWANFYCAMAYPGSQLYEQAVREGWTLPATWRGYSQHNDDCRPLDTETLSGAEVLRFRDQAFRTYFSSPAYRSMVRSRFGPHAEADVDRMLSYQLRRKLLEPA